MEEQVGCKEKGGEQGSDTREEEGRRERNLLAWRGMTVQKEEPDMSEMDKGHTGQQRNRSQVSKWVQKGDIQDKGQHESRGILCEEEMGQDSQG